MSNFEINLLGQRLSILSNDGTHHSANVLNLYDNCFSIQMPKKDDFKIEFNSIVKYYVSIGRYAYLCSSFVIACKDKYDSQFAILSEPKILEKTDRRKFVRMPCLIFCEYGVVPNEMSLEDIESKEFIPQMKETMALDISQGGIKIFTEEKLENYSKIFVRLEGSFSMSALGTVVRTEYDIINDKNKIAIQFMEMDEDSRDSLLDLLFDLTNKINV